jgi:hypothetical protein
MERSDRNAGIRHGKGAIALLVVWEKRAIALWEEKGDRTFSNFT